MQLRKESLPKTKNSGLPVFKPQPLRYRCNALTNTYYIAIGRYPIPHKYFIYFTLPPQIYSVRIQNTFSKMRVVCIKRYTF